MSAWYCDKKNIADNSSLLVVYFIVSVYANHATDCYFLYWTEPKIVTELSTVDMTYVHTCNFLALFLICRTWRWNKCIEQEKGGRTKRPGWVEGNCSGAGSYSIYVLVSHMNKELYILGWEQRRVRDSLIEQHWAHAKKPASFWREKRDTVVILVRGFAKLLSCQNKSRSR